MPTGQDSPGANHSAWSRTAASGKVHISQEATLGQHHLPSSPSHLRLSQFQGSRAHQPLPEMQQPTQKLGSEMASADSPRLCSVG